MTDPFLGGMHCDTRLHDDGLGLTAEVRWDRHTAPENIPVMAGSIVSDALKHVIIQPSLDELAIKRLRQWIKSARDDVGRAEASPQGAATYEALTSLEAAIADDDPAVSALARSLFGESAFDVCLDGPTERTGGAE